MIRYHLQFDGWIYFKTARYLSAWLSGASMWNRIHILTEICCLFCVKWCGLSQNMVFSGRYFLDFWVVSGNINSFNAKTISRVGFALGSGESGVPQNYITPSKLRRFHLAIVNTIIIIINQPMSLSITDGEHHSSTQDPFIIPLISLWYPQLWYSQLWQSSMYLMVTYTWVMPKCCESLLLASVFRLLVIVRYAPWFGKSSLHLLENMQFQASSQWYRARAKISGQDAISKTQDQRPQCDSFTKAPLRATNFSQETISGCCLFALSHTSFYSASCFHFITFYIS